MHPATLDLEGVRRRDLKLLNGERGAKGQRSQEEERQMHLMCLRRTSKRSRA